MFSGARRFTTRIYRAVLNNTCAPERQRLRYDGDIGYALGAAACISRGIPQAESLPQVSVQSSSNKWVDEN
ncbi:hypothetical protein EGD00_02675 [Pectobacterium carotovorum subsp. carotovorum]|nr:hypothetical protein EGD00_02675 [Pectobacterium carotovorum subsp. carotovorum]